MKLYPYLMASCFTFLKRFETSVINSSDENRAFRVALIFALAEVFNLYSIKPNQGSDLVFVPFSILALLNYVVFLPKKRYVKYVDDYRKEPLKNMYGILTILYFVGTLIFYHYTH